MYALVARAYDPIGSRAVKRARALTLTGALLLYTPVAAAQQCDDVALESEERQGQRANLDGRHAEARAFFEAVYARCQRPRSLARLALTEAALGRWLDADTHLRAALASDDPWIAAHRAALEVERDRIGQHIGSLLVAGEGTPGTVSVDGRPAGPWPMTAPLRLPIGRVTVRVEVPGCVPVTRSVQVNAGELAREEVAPSPAPEHDLAAATAPARAITAAPPPAAPPTPAPATPRSTAGPWLAVGWTAAGLGLGMLAVGTVFVLRRDEALGEIDALGCLGPSPPAARCDALADTADLDARWILVGFTAGAALALTATLAFVLPRNSASPARALRCVPGLVVPGAACGLRF